MASAVTSQDESARSRLRRDDQPRAVRRRRPGVPRRPRHQASTGDLRLGARDPTVSASSPSGHRSSRPPIWPRPGRGPRPSSTPASGGSPVRRPTADGACPATTSGSTTAWPADYKIPSMAVYGIGLGMVAPTILAHATEEVKQATLRPMYRGDIVGCQLFSEPSSGSRPRLAPDQSRARRRRMDHQRPEGVDVGGPSVRHRRDRLPERSRSAQAPAASPASSSTCTHPGVEVRPLRQMTGGRRSTRSSSPTSGSPIPTAWATSTADGRWPSPP